MNDTKLIEILWICVTFLSVCLGIAISCLREKNKTVSKLKNKKRFIQTRGNAPTNSYIINTENISFIHYDDKNDVARVYYYNDRDNWIEVDIRKPFTKADFVNALNNGIDLVVGDEE